MKRRVTRRQAGTGVAFHRLASGKKRVFDQRTIRVLGSLVVGMTLISAILLYLEPNQSTPDNVLSLSALDMASDSARDEILGVKDDRPWKFIIIHDSRGVSGGMSKLDAAWNADYARRGLPANRGAGYHFVINDRQGKSDGAVEIASRWTRQESGDYIPGEEGDIWNREAIGICLMGDADARPFSDDQFDATVKLVRMLQQAYGISRDDVYIDTGRSANSLAPYFPTAKFRNQIHE